jgi:hypothetical protein
VLFAEQPHGGNELEGRAGEIRDRRGERHDLLVGREAGRNRTARRVVVGRRVAGREAHTAAGQGLAQECDHSVQLLGGGLLAHGVFAHHHPPQCRVADEEAGVDREPALDARQVVIEAAPVPGHARCEGLDWHALDPRQHRLQVVAGFLAEGRDAEAAVAAEHGRHAVQR